MSKYYLIFLLLCLFACRTEPYFFKKVLKTNYPNFAKTDTLIFHFEGKIRNNYPYSKGKVAAYYSGNKLQTKEYGYWKHFHTADTSDMWAASTFDTLGAGLLLSYQLLSFDREKIDTQITCKDTLINEVALRKCDYVWYFDDGQLALNYAIVTFDNPDRSGEKYGLEIQYDQQRNVLVRKMHTPKITEGSIKKE